MNTKLKAIVKRDYHFYMSLIFFVFAFVYTVDGTYPFYALPMTICAIFSYLAMLYTNNNYLIFIEWFYLVVYIAYFTLMFSPMNMLYCFFLSNMLIYRFRDSYSSYRTISFLITINYLMIHNSLLDKFPISDKIIMFVFYFICLGMYFFQKKSYENSILKEERTRRNEHINILLTENERNRIGQDLHDSIGHTFVMLKLKAELAEKYLEKNNIKAAKSEIIEIRKISQDSMKNTRDIINKLKYRTIEEELHIIENIMAMSGIKLTINNNISTKPSSINEWTLTMVLKELANNVIKHSKATNCDIIIKEIEKEYSILFLDNGCGFEEINGNELKSIKERLKTVDGKLEIISLKNPTTIKLTIDKNY